jgi:ribosomal-protein-alanine N-acetyltransferase
MLFGNSISMSTILETNRLLLRILTLDDLDDLAPIYADPEVMRYIGPPRSREESRVALSKMIDFQKRHGFGLWATEKKRPGN